MQELLNKLPSRWEDITLEQFQNLTETTIHEDGDILNGIENSIGVLSQLLQKPIEELEELPIRDLAHLTNKISFMSKAPAYGKTSIIDWKPVDDITYNDFMLFTSIQDNHLQKMHIFLKNFSNTKLSTEELLQLPITEVMTGFFLLRNQLRQYAKRLVKSTQSRLKKQKKIQRKKQVQ